MAPGNPVPKAGAGTCEIVPPGYGETRRMTVVSEKKSCPHESNAMPLGAWRRAAVAGPPLPPTPFVPMPAITVMVDEFEMFTSQTIKFSAMSTFPAGSTATAQGT